MELGEKWKNEKKRESEGESDGQLSTTSIIQHFQPHNDPRTWHVSSASSWRPNAWREKFVLSIAKVVDVVVFLIYLLPLISSFQHDFSPSHNHSSTPTPSLRTPIHQLLLTGSKFCSSWILTRLPPRHAQGIYSGSSPVVNLCTDLFSIHVQINNVTLEINKSRYGNKVNKLFPK